MLLSIPSRDNATVPDFEPLEQRLCLSVSGVSLAASHTVRGDFNNDGISDLVSSVRGGHGLAIQLGRAQGGYTRRTLIGDNNFASGAAVATGDFNNDGNLDLLVYGQGRRSALLARRAARTAHHAQLKALTTTTTSGLGSGTLSTQTGFNSSTMNAVGTGGVSIYGSGGSGNYGIGGVGSSTTFGATGLGGSYGGLGGSSGGLGGSYGGLGGSSGGLGGASSLGGFTGTGSYNNGSMNTGIGSIGSVYGSGGLSTTGITGTNLLGLGVSGSNLFSLGPSAFTSTNVPSALQGVTPFPNRGLGIGTSSALFGNGAGSLATGTTTTTGASGALLVSARGTAPVRGGAYILLGDGDGTFHAPQAVGGARLIAGGANSTIGVGDVNNDGVDDIIVGRSPVPRRVQVLLGSGGGAFQSVRTIRWG